MSGTELTRPLLGGGAAGELIRSIAWEETPLGPIEDWPHSLRSTLGILLHSRHPMFLWWGPKLIQFYNDAYTPSFGVGKHPAAMGQPGRECWREIWPIIGPQIEDVMLRGVASWNEDQLVPILRNGRLEDVYWTYGYSPVYADDGSIGGTLVVCTETTPRVLAAERMRALTQEVQAASSAKDEFLAVLGHELRNPLSPITTALELMKLRGGGKASPEEAVIERQVRHLTRLVDDLLDVAKITRGKVELKREVLEISTVFARAVEIASFLFEQRGHRLSIDAPQSGLQLIADPVRLAQVVANLLTNAARYTAVGGNVSLSARRDADQIVITVTDDGRGIYADVLPRIFEPFVQGKRTQERAEGGLGLGLALVKNLVSLHGGQVEAHSDGPDQGSTFSVRLPALPESHGSEPMPSKPAPAPLLTGKRVLVVDDNADAADLLKVILDTVGHQVTSVHGPLEALALLATWTPEVAVLDIGLPVMDGYELGARIRTAAPGCRLIALTGYGQREDRARSALAGFDAHLVKPIEVQDLLSALVDLPR